MVGWHDEKRKQRGKIAAITAKTKQQNRNLFANGDWVTQKKVTVIMVVIALF